MPFHLLTYRVSAGVNDSDVDMAFITANAEEFTGRNNHVVFTEQYQLLGACHMGASTTRARIACPSFNRVSQYHIWPTQRAATPTSDPRVFDIRSSPLILPTDEEIQILESGNLGAGNEEETTFLWIAPPNAWNQNLPQPAFPGARLLTRATGALARTATSWATAGAFTFAANLLGGWYAVCGAFCQSANGRAFRINFPRWNVVNGRKLRPGSLCSTSLGDIDYRHFGRNMGVWGYFHSFEPPTFDLYADAAGADTQEFRLDLCYLGQGSRDQPPPGAMIGGL